MAEIGQNQIGRIHALDALRAIMMLLGIVLHSSEPYTTETSQLWPKDPNTTSGFFSYLSSIIHIFRMPTFFLISGFFASMLFYQRSPYQMITQRFKRVVLPFLVFLLALHPLVYHSYALMIESFGLVDFPSVPFGWVHNITYHLWFLYYLILITGITSGLAWLLRLLPTVGGRIKHGFEWLLKRQLFFIFILCLVVFLILVWIWNYWAPTPLSFLPNIKILTFYLVFYLFGWILFKSRNLLEVFMTYDRTMLVLAFIIYTSKFILHDHIRDVFYGALNTVVGWFFVFGFIGLFLRYYNAESRFRRYLSDSSYWVYLIHLPFTLLIPAIIVDLEAPAAIKFLITVVGTVLICYISYHYMVRSTFIGKFLNGRKY
ncbi:MAG: acyltransferase family protein [Ekhidna sp.]|nr:acyltransferase family protein [Ekhidna sp.]